jgi:hypothetical protein
MTTNHIYKKVSSKNALILFGVGCPFLDGKNLP